MNTLCLIFALASLAAAQDSFDQQVDAAFANYSKPASPGCALAVIKDGRIIYKHGYGQADLSHDIPIAPGTVFDVGSISKQFTAGAIVMLQLEGKLSLDDQVRKYLPGLPDYGVPLTLRHLIHHASGIKDEWNLLGLAGWRMGEDLYTDEDLQSMLFRQKSLNFKPGDKHVYSNSNYTLLAQIVRVVSGQTLREFTAARIFTPLGMKNSRFRDDHNEVVRNLASGYSPKGTGFERSSPTFNTVGPTGLLTTVEDFAIWDENFYSPRIGGPAFVHQMLEKGKLNNGVETDYAFGLEVSTYRGQPVVTHSGGNPGYRGDVIRFPEQHFSVVCLCNTDGVRPDFLTRKVADIYLASSLQPAPAQRVDVTKELTKEQLQSKTGFYWNKDIDDVRKVVIRDGKLIISQTGTGAPLIALTENNFITAGPVSIEYRFEPIAGSSRPRFTELRALADPALFLPAEEFSPTAKELTQYSGRYRSEELDVAYTITARNDKLFLSRPKFPEIEMRPTVRDVFVATDRNLRFLRDTTGAVNGIVLNQARTHNIRFARVLEDDRKK